MTFDDLLGRPEPLRARLQRVPVVLAPLSGVTDAVFRRVAARSGAGLVVTEMVSAEGFIRGDEEARLRREASGFGPHVVQLVGRSPERMGEAARLAEASGADIVDINLGCPAKKVTGGLAGAALMREPATALAIVAAVRAAVTVPVTIKMRLGWDEGSINAPNLAQAATALGVSGITVHGRTRQQFYTGRADWQAIRRVVESADVPVVANGDVESLASARACLDASGAAAVMVGRAAVGQPWLVGSLARRLAGRPDPLPAPATRAALAIEHYEGMLSLYGRDLGIRHARKHLAAYADRAEADGWGLAADERGELVRSDRPDRVVRLLGRCFEAGQRMAA